MRLPGVAVPSAPPGQGVVAVEQVKLPGFVGMLSSGRSDLAGRAKGIVRGGDRQFVLDELELGYRVAITIRDPEQAWWVIRSGDFFEEDEPLEQVIEAFERGLQRTVKGRDQQGQDPEE